MDPAYAARYGELYRRHWWWRAREEFIVRELRRLRPPRGRILDIGSGDGLLFDRLSEFGDPFGIEPDAGMLGPEARNRSRIHVGSLESFRSGHRFSLILMLDVLEHVAEPAGFLRRAAALLDQGGCLLITVPAFRSLWTSHDVVNHHQTRYTRSSLHPVLIAAGLRPLRLRYFFHWLFAAKLATRAWEALVRPEPAAPRVPPPWINAAALGVSRVEQGVGGLIPLPFGSSLLAVANVA